MKRQQQQGPVVDHLTMEISGITYFALKRGATVSEEVCSKYWKESPLPLQVRLCMSVSVVNHLILSHYEMLLRNLYIDPKDEPMKEAKPRQSRTEINEKKEKNMIKPKDTRQMFCRKANILREKQAMGDEKNAAVDWFLKTEMLN